VKRFIDNKYSNAKNIEFKSIAAKAYLLMGYMFLLKLVWHMPENFEFQLQSQLLHKLGQEIIAIQVK
jgi:hypothetical protein